MFACVCAGVREGKRTEIMRNIHARVCTHIYWQVFDFGRFLDDLPSLSTSSSLDTPPFSVRPLLG